MTKREKYYLDIIKIIAIWMVIYNHTNKMGFTVFTEKLDSRFFWIYLSFSILIKNAVPLFWMVSGALLLNKEESIKKNFTKRISRYIICIIVFSFVQFLYQIFWRKEIDFSIQYYLEYIYSDCFAVAYWFLYAYLGFLFMLPLMRRMVRSMQREEFYYVIAIYLIFNAIIPIIEYFLFNNELKINRYFGMPIMLTDAIVYPMLGYYIEHIKKKEEFTGKRIISLAIASIIAILISAVLTKYKCDLTNDWKDTHVETFFSSFIIIPTYTIFYTIKYIAIKYECPEKMKKVITALGSCVLGIMLIENILRDNMIPWYKNDIIFACLKVTEIWLAGFAIIFILKKIPILRKII